ncbi:MAG: hypothetical protein LBJ10_08680, partial [Clostridiales bacterium]|nr:hypothetical protein [Clostridiales bacterium]
MLRKWLALGGIAFAKRLKSRLDGDARVAEQAISFRRGIEPTPCASGSDGASHAGGASANG